MNASIEQTLLVFLKRTYKIPLSIVVAVVFFAVYNRYLVDNSLRNLRVALDRLNNVKTLGDAQKLSVTLDYSLFQEAASPEIETASFSNLELAKDILNKPENAAQLEDVKFVLKKIVEQKEKARSPILVALDSINRLFAPGAKKFSKAELENQVRSFTQKLPLAQTQGDKQFLYYQLGNIYTQLSKFSEARQAYASAIGIASGTRLAERAKFNIAWNEKRGGNFEEAIRQFETIAKTSPDSKLAVFSQYQTAEIYRKKGEPEKAIALYQKIGTEGKDKDLSRLAEFKVGYTYLYDLKDYEKAKTSFGQSMAVSQDADMINHIGKETLRGIGLQYRKEGFTLLKQGYAFSSAVKYKEALLNFEKSLEIIPQDGVVYIGKALGYLWLKDKENASRAAREAVKLMPQDETVSVNAGYVYLQLGLVEEAIGEYQRFTTVNPFTARGYYNLGYAYILYGRFNEALVSFEKTTKIDPGYYLAFNNKGWCLWQLKQYSQAIEAFERAVKLQPEFVDALFNLGTIYKTIGKFEEAKNKLESILDVHPTHPKARQYLKEVDQALYKTSNIQER